MLATPVNVPPELPPCRCGLFAWRPYGSYTTTAGTARPRFRCSACGATRSAPQLDRLAGCTSDLPDRRKGADQVFFETLASRFVRIGLPTALARAREAAGISAATASRWIRDPKRTAWLDDDSAPPPCGVLRSCLHLYVSRLAPPDRAFLSPRSPLPRYARDTLYRHSTTVWKLLAQARRMAIIVRGDSSFPSWIDRLAPDADPGRLTGPWSPWRAIHNAIDGLHWAPTAALGERWVASGVSDRLRAWTQEPAHRAFLMALAAPEFTTLDPPPVADNEDILLEFLSEILDDADRDVAFAAITRELGASRITSSTSALTQSDTRMEAPMSYVLLWVGNEINVIVSSRHRIVGWAAARVRARAVPAIWAKLNPLDIRYFPKGRSIRIPTIAGSTGSIRLALPPAAYLPTSAFPKTSTRPKRRYRRRRRWWDVWI